MCWGSVPQEVDLGQVWIDGVQNGYCRQNYQKSQKSTLNIPLSLLFASNDIRQHVLHPRPHKLKDRQYGRGRDGDDVKCVDVLLGGQIAGVLKTR